MKPLHLALLLVLPVSLARAQSRELEFTDPLALLRVVSETYAANPDSFHVESITETIDTNDLRRDWRKVYRTAIKGPGNLYRIETRSPFGSYIQDSDGKNEWVYLVEANIYVVRPLPQRWPQFPKLMVGGNNELNEAWNMRTWLETEASGNKRATHAARRPSLWKVNATLVTSSTLPATIARQLTIRTCGGIEPSG
jgi:outer membrane lipoprotein-sorting protein